VKNRLSPSIIFGAVIILLLFMGAFFYAWATKSAKSFALLVLFTLALACLVFAIAKKRIKEAKITGEQVYGFREIYAAIQQWIHKSDQAASRTPEKSSPASGSKGGQTTGRIRQIRAAMLELRFWRFVWRVGCLLVGYLYTTFMILGYFIAGDTTLLIIFGNIIGGLFWGFLFGIFFWFFIWLIARVFYNDEKPLKSGKYYDQWIQNTSGPRLKRYSLYFLIFIVVMSVVSLIVPPDTPADIPVYTSENFVNYTTETPVIEIEYSLKINVIAPVNSYDCVHPDGSPLNAADVAKASRDTVDQCNAWNYCDVMTPSDLVVRKTAAEAIAEHLDRPYSTIQLVDIYAWAKKNVEYQNVPLNNAKPYRPSETIFTKTADCKNYAALISSMVLSIGGNARIVTAIGCRHAWAEVLIGEPNDLPASKRALDAFAQAIKEKYQQDIELNIIRDEVGYWVILDGSGAVYPGTNTIPGCLDPEMPRHYSYSCVSQEGNINKQTYKKEQVSSSVEAYCVNCRSVNDCQDECQYRCIKAGWDGFKTWDGRVMDEYPDAYYVACTCSCIA